MNRRMMMAVKTGGHAPRLPSEYQEVEWIQSTGTQYINTGVNISASQGFEIDAEWSYYNNSALIGLADKINRSDYGLCSWNNMVLFQYTGSLGVGNLFGSRHKFTALAKELYVDDVLKVTATQGVFNPPNSVYIFWFGASSYGGSIAYKARAKVYEAKLFDSNFETIRHYIPCYRVADGEIGFYELFTGAFLANNGTGTFTKGANIN